MGEAGCRNCASTMTEEGVTKVKLHKQEPTGLVTSETPADTIASTEKKEDPDELGSEDFKAAADNAQAQLSAVAASAQQGMANVLESIQQTLAPKAEEKEVDPEVQEFRSAAAEAAQEAKAYMEPGETKETAK